MSAEVVRVVHAAARVASCTQCGRSAPQHGRLACAAIDEIAARVEYGALPLARRLFRRAPRGWRS
jgi:hypothetical protein